MSGPGRQAYHGKPPVLLLSHVAFVMGHELMKGIPRIMEGTLPSHFSIHEHDSEVVKAVEGYIVSGRVNINARQVFPPGFKRS
jgi:alkylated DNA repair protein alkB family protein 1